MSCLITLSVICMFYGAITNPSPIKGTWITILCIMLSLSVAGNIITYKEDGKSDKGNKQ